jgi:HK97 gp10 family phage protein
MAKSDVKLTGFKELHAALGELPKATENGVLRRVATKALEPMAEDARRRAPVDDGTLRDSIHVGTKLSKGARAAARKDPVEGVRVFMGSSGRNAIPREFGSSRSPAHPYMRPAWDAGKDRLLDDVMTGLATEIDKTATRLAKRRAKK